MRPPRLEGFAPLGGPDARVLVLGTMPGARSLAEAQYYAHPQNAFWRIMAALYGLDPRADYAARVAALTAARVAVWDVLRACHRAGSLDTAIDPTTAVANDFRAFLATRPGLRLIAFNGGKAEALFHRHVRPRLEGLVLPAMQRLPSTSPANARLPFDAKLEAWRALAAATGEE
jgi:hypoxanthine-DNA glycosylase